MSYDVHTSTLRRFNRSYTQRIGALDESFLGLGLPLGSARLLFEVGAEPTTVHRLRTRLGLDSGYLSRLLRRLEDTGLVEIGPDPADRRRRTVGLTKKGHTTWRNLDDRSEQLAKHLVEPLTERQRQRLTDALATADLLVRAATVTLEGVDPSAPEAVAALGNYFAELDRRFESGFDPGDAFTADAAAMSAPHGVFVVAVSEGDPVACGGVQRLEPGVCEIKRMWVHDHWRGAGLGSRLLRRLEDEATRLGARRVRLDTNGTLLEAIAMYERAGYQATGRYNDNPYAQAWFEKDVSPAAR